MWWTNLISRTRNSQPRSGKHTSLEVAGIIMIMIILMIISIIIIIIIIFYLFIVIIIITTTTTIIIIIIIYYHYYYYYYYYYSLSRLWSDVSFKINLSKRSVLPSSQYIPMPFAYDKDKYCNTVKYMTSVHWTQINN